MRLATRPRHTLSRAEVGEISMDARWADFGEFGHVSARWNDGQIRDAEELAFARAVAAAAGPICTDSWSLDTSRGDRSKVEAVRWPAWSSPAWTFMVVTKTERLVRSEAFRRLHRRIVTALEQIGDFGTLSGDELRAVLSPPGATSFVGAPRSEAAASAGVRAHSMKRSRLADAAMGEPRPSLPPAAGIPPTFGGEPCLT
jgi:hypothetical protein